jgi:hypothetical protein
MLGELLLWLFKLLQLSLPQRVPQRTLVVHSRSSAHRLRRMREDDLRDLRRLRRRLGVFDLVG